MRTKILVGNFRSPEDEDGFGTEIVGGFPGILAGSFQDGDIPLEFGRRDLGILPVPTINELTADPGFRGRVQG
jgi:hypothetical protein